MKTILFVCLLGLVVPATAQTSVFSSTHSQINDDDKTLSIRIDGERNGKPVVYNRTFDVRGMNKSQKEALKSRVLDSLGLGLAPPPPPPPKPPVSDADQPTVTFTCASCTGKSKMTISGDGLSITQERSDGKLFPIEQKLAPGNYRYSYWQNGVLQMQLPFSVKAGEENVVNVK